VSPRELRRKILGRRSVRARIALACAGLFLVTGAAFVAVTYTLVDHSLSSAALTNQTKIPPSLLPDCKTAQRNGTLTGALAAQCQKIVAGAAQFGAANQRAHDLRQLLLWSLVGLGVATVVAGGLGWAIGRRILLPLHKVTGAARRAAPRKNNSMSGSASTDPTTN
jgi:hypothetical protein